MGVGGDNIKKLINEFDCEINVPRQGQIAPVVLVGNVTNVNALADKIRSYCIEERLFKFPTPNMKSSIMSKIGADETFFQGVQVKAHANGIFLIGEIDKIDDVKQRLQQEIANHQP